MQLIRIQMRVPEYGWTTQKVFHLLNFLVASLRLGVFACWRKVGGHLETPTTAVQFHARDAFACQRRCCCMATTKHAEQHLMQERA